MTSGNAPLQTSPANDPTAEYERATIGAVLIAGGQAVEIAEGTGLRAADFGRKNFAQIWSAIAALHARGDAVATSTVIDELHRSGKLDDVGGMAAVAQLESMIYSPEHVTTYASHIVDQASYRRIIDTAQVAMMMAHKRSMPPGDCLARIQEAFLRLGKNATDDLGFVDRRATIDRVMSRVGKPPEGTLPTGFFDLDEMLSGGANPGRLYVVAGRPGMGKSAFGHQWATQVADLGVPAALFSLEMAGEELLTREIAGAARANAATWSRRDEGARATKAAAEIADRPLHLCDRAGLDIAGVCSRARRMTHREKIALLVVDYLGLINGGDRYSGNKTNEVAEITKSLKELAQNLEIPVVLLAQLNRDVEKRPGKKRPQMSDLRDSGSIEQDADVVIFLHREEYYYQQRGEECPEELQRRCEVLVAKNRSGRTGSVDLIFDGPSTRFSNMAPDR